MRLRWPQSLAGTGMAMLCAAAVNSAATSSAWGNINVELRPVNQTVSVGTLVNIGLYLVSDQPTDQYFAAAQVIITWNTSRLQLLGLTNVGAIPLLVSSFGAEPYGLNTSLSDGDAMWLGYAPLGNPVAATSSGTLLTTLRFQALSISGFTPVGIAPTAGNPPGSTVVFDGAVPGLSVTGSLTGATIQIIPVPGAWCVLIGAAAAARRRRRLVDDGDSLTRGSK